MGNSVGILKEYLVKVHPRDLKQLAEKDIAFLAEYSIERRQSKTAERIKELKIGTSYDQYFNDNELAKTIRNEIQDIHARFNNKRREDTEDETAFDNSFEKFFEWWINKMDSNGKHICYYCQVNEEVVRAAFKGGFISSEKPSFNGSLQIERKNPKGGYNNDNCEFACVLCNNAKSDMISEEDFKEFFAPGIKKYWNNIKKHNR